MSSSLSILKIPTTIRCLISAGPTREWIDPVRFISNPSSGKMGFAIAQAARNLGMSVTLVSGPVALSPLHGVDTIHVETAIDMKNEMLKQFEHADLTIMTAAVSDHRPRFQSEHKLSKDNFPLSLPLEKNPDILKLLGTQKKPGQRLVGFAAETENVMETARKKLIEKKLDWIVANDVSRIDQGFSSDLNEVLLLGPNDFQKRFNLAEKTIIAEEILNEICSLWLEKAH